MKVWDKATKKWVELSDFYDMKYVEKIINKEWRYNLAPIQVKILYDFFQPKSILDIGAANGLHTKEFKKFGCYTFGIEGTKHFGPFLKRNANDYLIQDIRESFDLGKIFDLVFSVEVLEHIEEKHTDIVLDNICKHGDILFITANPSCGGKGHYNPQPKQYWIKKFNEKGFRFCENETKKLSEMFKILTDAAWYRDHSGIYSRRE